MSLVHVVPGLKVTNPIGYINLSPPPAGLPAGLVRLHLVRNSIDFTRINRVTGAPTALAEILLDGPVSYTATHGLSTRRRSGWATVAWDYANGFTMMAVAVPHEIAETPVNAPVVGTYVYSSGQQRGSLLRLQPGFVRFQTFQGATSGATVNANYTPSEPMAAEPTMVFAGVNGPTQKYFVCVPHLNAYREADADIQALTPYPNNGLSFGMANVSSGSSETNAVQDLRAYLIGIWDRPLSLDAMQTSRELFTPWLAEHNVALV